MRPVRPGTIALCAALALLAVAPPLEAAPPRGRDLAPALQRALQRACRGSVCLLVDYDGTLREFERTPEAARPSAATLGLLRRLASTPRIEVNIVSGRKRENLEEWFGGLPVGLYAEHGLWGRRPGQAWVAARDLKQVTPDLEKVRPLFDGALKQSPGTLLEEKSAGLVFHYRTARDPARAEQAAGTLAATLRAQLQGSPFEVLEGNKVCEVRLREANKGSVAGAIARRLRAAGSRALLIAIGDDRTDEDMFAGAAQARGAVTIKVGEGSTRAAHRLPDPAAVRSFLRSLLR